MMVSALRLQVMGSYTVRLLGMGLLALALTTEPSPVCATEAPQDHTDTPADRALQAAAAFIAQWPQQREGSIALVKASIRNATRE